ncbi:MAG: hypothetical protein KA773_19740, partial [Chloroflexi bacterium]|nr:hypothetical protein [Chloroflexota bacterium]
MAAGDSLITGQRDKKTAVLVPNQVPRRPFAMRLFAIDLLPGINYLPTAAVSTIVVIITTAVVITTTTTAA